MKFDPSKVEKGHFSLVPVGTYTAMVMSCSLRSNKTNDGAHVNVEFGFVHPIYKARKLWHNFNIKNPNETAQNIGLSDMKAFCSALGINHAVDVASELPLLVKHKTLRITLKHGADFRDKAKQRESITDFLPLDGDGGTASAPAILPANNPDNLSDVPF